LGSKNSSSQNNNNCNSPIVTSKTLHEKCQNISDELNNLEKEVEKFDGKKGDKIYLKLEEFLTRCLLKLDEIERGDEQINQTRKRLINFANGLTDKLDLKAISSGKSIDDNNDLKNENNNDAVLKISKLSDLNQKIDEQSNNLKDTYQTSYLTVNPN
jgi:hypothetical protein